MSQFFVTLIRYPVSVFTGRKEAYSWLLVLCMVYILNLCIEIRKLVINDLKLNFDCFEFLQKQ